MQDIIQELIALTYTRRDWKGYPNYLEHITPVEDAIEKKLEESGVQLEVSWDYQLKMYGLFPIHLLFPGNSQLER